MSREVIKLLKYSKAEAMLLKKMTEQDLTNCFTDSRNLTNAFLFEHFLKASQALNTIEKTMHDIYRQYEHLYNNNTLNDKIVALLIDRLTELRHISDQYYYFIRGVDITKIEKEKAN